MGSEREKESAPGQDRVKKHLRERHRRSVGFFQQDMDGRCFTYKSWKEAIVTSMRKPGKDHSIPANYRPIALTSHECKIMEK